MVDSPRELRALADLYRRWAALSTEADKELRLALAAYLDRLADEKERAGSAQAAEPQAVEACSA